MKRHRFLFVCSVVLFSVASASAAQACPILNGEYGMEFIAKDGKRMLNTEFYSTRQQGGAFFYSVDAQGKDHHEANSTWRPITVGGREGQTRFICIGNSLKREAKANDSDQVWWSVITPMDRTRLNIESNRTGVYTWRSSSPTP